MKRNIVAVILLFSVLWWGGLRAGWAGEPDNVDALIQVRMKDRDIPGLSLVVIRSGQIIKHQAYGLASLELNVPVTSETVFQIASTTKVFAGVATMMLVDEGKLSLDDSVTDLLPGLPARWKEVTVDHLLTHTSGLPNVVREGGEVLPGKTFQDVIDWVAGKPDEFRPGDRFSYNQTGYLLANLIIQAKSGKTWEEFARERFFRPLGMSATSFGDQHELIRGRASIYEGHPSGGNRPYHRAVYDFRMWAAAGLNTTPGDLARWLIALQTGQMLKPASRDLLWSPVKLNDGREFWTAGGRVGSGKGWLIFNYASGHRAVGGEGGYTNAFLYFPKHELTVIVMTNKERSDDLGIVAAVAKLYIPDLS